MMLPNVRNEQPPGCRLVVVIHGVLDIVERRHKHQSKGCRRLRQGKKVDCECRAEAVTPDYDIPDPGLQDPVSVTTFSLASSLQIPGNQMSRY